MLETILGAGGRQPQQKKLYMLGGERKREGMDKTGTLEADVTWIWTEELTKSWVTGI